MADPAELPEITVNSDDNLDKPSPDKAPAVITAGEGPWSKYQSGADKKPWEKYSAQGDPDASGALGRGLQRRARGGASEFKLDDIYGRETNKYDYSGAPLEMQKDVAAASGPDEIRLALEKYVADKPEDVGQDKQGRWWVDIKGKKTIVEPEMLAKILSSAPTTMGAGAGTAGGAAIGTAIMPGPGTAAGAIIGGGLGGMVGKGLEDVQKAVKGNYATPTSEEIARLGWTGLENAGFSAIAPAVQGAKELSRSAYRSAVGVARHQEAVNRATRIWGDSGGKVIPPVQSFAPEASRMVKGEQSRNEISYGGISPENAKRIEYMKNRFQRVLQNSGMPPAEIDSAINDVISGKSATSGTSAGTGIVDRAQRTVRQAEQTIAADVDAARNILRNEEATYRQYADSSGRVGENVEAWIEQERGAFYGHFDAAYNNVDRLGGNARVVDLAEASAAAERLMQTVEPGNVPPLVARVAGLRGEATALNRQAARLRAEGNASGAEQLENQAHTMLNRTIEEAHGLRTLLREGMRAQTRGGGPVGTSYHFLSAIEDAVDSRFADLARSGTGLSSEAAGELSRVDRAYRDGIRYYKNQTIKKITRDAQDGTFATPEVIARNILNPNEMEAARNIFGRMPPPLQQQVLAADMHGKLFRASEQDSVTGNWVVRGKDFLREWRKSRGVQEFYPPAFRQNVERWASELAAVEGHLELTALQNPSQITRLLESAANEERALNDFVRNDPVGALASGEPHMIDKAVKEIAKPGAERSTERAINRIGRGTPEWQRVTHWAMIDLFEGAIRKTEAGEIEVLGKDVLNKLNSYTKKQQDMLFPGSLVDDIRVLGEDVFALFPRGGNMATGLSSGTVTHTSVLNLRQVWKQMRFYTLGKIADSQAYLALVADLKRNHPNWDAIKTGLGQMGRTVFNAEEAPPQENPGDGNQIPRLAEGGIVTKPTVAMVGERGPEMVVPLTEKGMGSMSGGGFNRSPGGIGGVAKNPLEMGGGLRQGLGQLGQNIGQKVGQWEQQAQGRQQNVMSEFQNMEGMFGNWLQQLMSKFPGAEVALAKYGIPGLADGGVVTEPTVAMLGEKGPEAVIPLDPAMVQQATPTQGAQPAIPLESALPQEPSNLLADASPQDQAMQAREAAAMRQQHAVQPPGGRQQGEFTEGLLDLAIPGRSVGRAIGQGEYGEAAVQAGMQAIPFAGKALSTAARAAPGLIKTVGAATGALTGLLTGSEAGRIPLDPEQRKRLQMEQQSLKQKQDAANAAAQQRLQEAEQKARIDSEAAERSAKTETERQKALAEIENNKQREQAEIIAKRHKEEENAAQRSLDAAKAEAKRMAERPFREIHPEAALGMTLGGMAVAAMLPTLSNAQKAAALNKYIKEWKQLDSAAAEALKSGTAQEKQIAVQRLSDASNKWVETKERLSAPSSVGTKLAYGMAGAEGAALPAEIDFGLQPKESEAHKSAEEFFTNPMEMARVVATYLGGTMAGMTASKYPFRTAEPPVGSGGLVTAYGQQQAAEKKAATAAKSAETRARKKAEAEKSPKKEPEKEEPRRAKVPRGGPKIYGLREE